MTSKLLNIAITGDSGTGKSSFINAIRGLTADDDGAAPVGVIETTTEPTPYPHPYLPNIILWDLPGVGTPKFPKHSYLHRIDFSNFDIFLIFISERFRENDIWLAKEVGRRQKKVFLVRTKIDSDIDNHRRSHPRTFNEDNVFATIFQDCLINLQKARISKPQVFLISNFDTDKWDFPLLAQKLQENLRFYKKDLEKQSPWSCIVM